MAINIADNFQYQGKKPLDSRTSYATLALMKAVTDSNINEGCLAYCEETQKHYEFKSTNTVDETTGKWREYQSGGGGGASDLSDLGDVDLTSPSDGQVLTYDAETGKWVNAEGGSASVDELGDIGDVDLDNIEDGQTIVWDAENSKWINATPSGGASDLDDLGDVEITTPSDGQVLKYNSTTEKWENGSGGGGGDAIVNGYAYTPPFTATGAMDYINWVKAHTDKTVNVSSESIFNGKTCNCFYMVLGPSTGYYLFSEYDFTLKTHWLTRSGTKIYNSSRYTTDGVNHPGYNSNGTFTYTNGITQANQVTIKGSSEVDCDYLADANKEAIVYASENVSFDEAYNAYKDNTVIIKNPLTFYSDSAHTTPIVPALNKIYVDIPTGKMYEWNGTEYTAVGGGEVPTKTSDLVNDSGFITKTVDDLTNYYKKTEIDEDKQNKLTEGDGIDITEDVIAIDPMPAEDIDEVVDIIPSGGRVAVTGYVPLGTLISYYGETAPRFFLACDGATYNKADYPELAEHLLSLTNHSQYEVDGDDTKFKVPDLRGEFVRGTGTNSHTNQGSGLAVGTHQDATEHAFIGVNTTNSKTIWTNSNKTSPNNSSGIVVLKVDTTISGETTTNGLSLANNTFATEWSGGTGNTNYTARPTNTSVLFCIAYKDIYSNPMNDYSTDEKVVGTWINGEPLYQKTLQITMPSANESSISTGVENGNHARIVDGFIEQTGSSGGNYSFPVMFDSGSPLTTKVLIQVTVNGSNLYVYSNFDKTDGKTAYITIQYTKTT